MTTPNQLEYQKRKAQCQAEGRCIRWQCPRPHRKNRLTCEECAAREKRYANARADDNRSSALKFRYGISLAEKQEMYEEQKGLCDMCSDPLPEDYRLAHVDHDHATGKVRALLHQRCNIVVGHIEGPLFDKAQRYIESHS